ncbi:MAG: chemotaxis protein CheB [Chloroflexota bacterium]
MARDLVVIGGSAGSIEALTRLVRGLPADYVASILVVVHVPPDAHSNLPRILARRSALPATHAKDGWPLVPGTIMVAPPDRHLVVEGDHVRVVRGPRENNHRPAIDPLFRSAAEWQDGHVTAVVLSGGPGDGVAGCMAVIDRGGRVIVQDPEEALFPQLPTSVLGRAEVDVVADSARIGSVLAGALRDASHRNEEQAARADRPEVVTMTEQAEDSANGRPSTFGCPDCGGVMWQIEDGRVLRFRCRVGHAHTGETLLEAQTSRLEDALWSALRGQEEKAELAERLAGRAEEQRFDHAAETYRGQAELATTHARTLREFLESMERVEVPASGWPVSEGLPNDAPVPESGEAHG